MILRVVLPYMSSEVVTRFDLCMIFTDIAPVAMDVGGRHRRGKLPCRSTSGDIGRICESAPRRGMDGRVVEGERQSTGAIGSRSIAAEISTAINVWRYIYDDFDGR